jgi:hypothetical protein
VAKRKISGEDGTHDTQIPGPSAARRWGWEHGGVWPFGKNGQLGSNGARRWNGDHRHMARTDTWLEKKTVLAIVCSIDLGIEYRKREL